MRNSRVLITRQEHFSLLMNSYLTTTSTHKKPNGLCRLTSIISSKNNQIATFLAWGMTLCLYLQANSIILTNWNLHLWLTNNYKDMEFCYHIDVIWASHNPRGFKMIKNWRADALLRMLKNWRNLSNRCPSKGSQRVKPISMKRSEQGNLFQKYY